MESGHHTIKELDPASCLTAPYVPSASSAGMLHKREKLLGVLQDL